MGILEWGKDKFWIKQNLLECGLGIRNRGDVWKGPIRESNSFWEKGPMYRCNKNSLLTISTKSEYIWVRDTELGGVNSLVNEGTPIRKPCWKEYIIVWYREERRGFHRIVWREDKLKGCSSANVKENTKSCNSSFEFRSHWSLSKT